MKKQIKINETETGQRYFFIYEVVAVKDNGERVVYDHFLKKDDADETADFVDRMMKPLYCYAFVTQKTVWC